MSKKRKSTSVATKNVDLPAVGPRSVDWPAVAAMDQRHAREEHEKYERAGLDFEGLVKAILGYLQDMDRHICQRADDEADPIVAAHLKHLARESSDPPPRRGAKGEAIYGEMQRRFGAVPPGDVETALAALEEEGFIRWAADQGQQNEKTVKWMGEGWRIKPYRITADGMAEIAPAECSLPLARHSKDFAWVHWYGHEYTFTTLQRRCVSEWWVAMENGTPDIGDDTVVLEAHPDGRKPKLQAIFKGNAAWGTLIVPGARKDTHRIAEPPKTQKN